MTRHGATPSEWAHFSMVLGKTEDLLPVVSNPDAKISSTSNVKQLGKVPSLYNSSGEAVGIAKWTSYSANDNDIDRWSANPDYGICCQTKDSKAIDGDLTDPAYAAQVKKFIKAFLMNHYGIKLPERYRSNSSKFLMPFTCPAEFGKRVITTIHGIIELLATGNQFVAVGRHTSGVPYEWRGGLPDSFPTLSLAQCDALWTALNDAFAIDPAASTSASSSVKREKFNGASSNDPVAQHLIGKSMVKKQEQDGRLHIVCPFESEHTSPASVGATTYWPAHTGGYERGHFKCLHAHCVGQSDSDFIEALGYKDPSLDSEFDDLRSDTSEKHVPISDISVHEPDRSQTTIEATAATVEATPATPEGRTFPFYKPSEFMRRPPVKWFVKHILPQAQIGIMFGQSGCGKTFVVLDMMCAIVRGVPYRGKKTIKSRVAYVCAEGAGGISSRLTAYCKHHQIPESDLDGLIIIPAQPNMLDEADAAALSRTIRMASGAGIIVLDTWAQVTAGGNENSGEDMGLAMKHCKMIGQKTGAMTLMVHHSGKDESRGARGHSSMRAASDFELEISRIGDEMHIMRVTKLKDGRDGDEFGFNLLSVDVGIDSDEEIITSCVVIEKNIGVAKVRPKAGIQTDLYTIMRAMRDEGTPLTVPPVIAEYQRTTPQSLDAKGFDRRAEHCRRALTLMCSNNILKLEDNVIELL